MGDSVEYSTCWKLEMAVLAIVLMALCSQVSCGLSASSSTSDPEATLSVAVEGDIFGFGSTLYFQPPQSCKRITASHNICHDSPDNEGGRFTQCGSHFIADKQPAM
jgi:hypothetical protein